MTRWLLIVANGTVDRECRAPDKWAAEDILCPVAPAFVVSALSWRESTVAHVSPPKVDRPSRNTTRWGRVWADPAVEERQRARVREANLLRDARRTAARQAAARKAAGRTQEEWRQECIRRGIERGRARRER